MTMNEKPACPKCKCEKVVKYGKVKGNQRFQCTCCSFQFTRLTPRGHSDSVKAMAVVLYTLGLSMNVIGKMFDVSAQSILNWVRNFAIANYEKPVPKDAIIVELDEMWHFLNSKKNKFGYGKLIAEKLESLSTGNAVAVIKKHS